MARITFDEIEAANPAIRPLTFEPRTESVMTTDEEFAAERARAAEIAERSVWGAAFSNDNMVGSFFSRSTPGAGLNNEVDPEFDLMDYIKSNGLQGTDAEEQFWGVNNKAYADYLLGENQRRQRNEETLAAAGLPGVLARIAAGTFDLPTLIPGGSVIKNVKGGYSIAKSALLTGTAAGAAAAIQEGSLQATQVGRSEAESYLNIGASVLLGGLIGGAAARVMTKAERKAAEAALDRLVTLPETGRRETQGIGAQTNPDAPPDIFEIVPREELARDAGTAGLAGAAVDWTSFATPVLRATQYTSNAARTFASRLYENSIYRTMHAAGKSLGPSPETMINVAQSGLARYLREEQMLYKEMKRAGINMRFDEFRRQVGRATMSNDQGANEFISRAAAAARKNSLDPMKDAALKTQKAGGGFLLEEKDLVVVGDESYGPRVYNVPRIKQQQAAFEDFAIQQIAPRMQQAYEEQTAALAARLQGYEAQIDDLSAAGAERTARLAEVDALAEKLDTEMADMMELANELRVANRLKQEAGNDFALKAEALAAIEDIKARGGDNLKAYRDRRMELRRRKRQLTRDNADAQAAKRAKIEDKIDEVRADDAAAVKVFSRRLKNIINQIDRNAPGRAQELLDSAVAEVERLNKLLGASEKRVAKLSEEPGEVPEGLAAWIAGERAAAEAAARAARDMVDQLQDIAARGVSDAEFDDLRAALELKPVATRADRLAAAEKQKGKREAKLAGAEKAVSERQQQLTEAQQTAADLQAKLEAVAEGISARSMRRGEYVQRQNERLAKLTPEEITARNKARIDLLRQRQAEARMAYAKKWEGRAATGKEKVPFENAAREVARDIFEQITGVKRATKRAPPGVVKATAGPLKDRTITFSSLAMADQGWVNTDIHTMLSRHSRAMAGDIELTRAFGSADLEEPLKQVDEEYGELAKLVYEAQSVEEINSIMGRKFAKPGADLAQVKQDAGARLAKEKDSALQDLSEGRDLMRGDFRPELHNTNWAAFTRIALPLNYIVRLGGVVLSSFTEIVRAPMVHGLRNYTEALARGSAATFGKGDEATQLLALEAERAGLVSQRVLNSLVVANADIGDPFFGAVPKVESFLERASNFASRWNGINLWTDWQQHTSSILSQHRIISGVLGEAGRDGSFLRTLDESRRMLAMLGIGDYEMKEIRSMLEQFSQEIDGIRVPNTEMWTSEAAVRAYRGALNLDVNRIVSRKGLGDAPLWANTPTGRLVFQFSGYAMGAHSRVMITGLQEDPRRFVSGLAVASVIGAATAYMLTFRDIDREKGAKRRKQYAENPLMLIGEGLDRSGIFPVLFDLSNRTERFTSSFGNEARFNPLKSPFAAASGQGFFGNESSRASDASGALSALGGPTLGLVEGAFSMSRVGMELAQGEEPPKRDTARALATLPFNSYPLMKDVVMPWIFEGINN